MDKADKRTFSEKVAACMADVGPVGKDGRNNDQRYDYTSAAAVAAAVQKAMARHGLYVASSTSVIEHRAEYQTKAGTAGTRITMRTTVTIADGSGAELHADGWGSGQDTQDKAVMKAQTASYKYALSAAFVIGFGDDPEADEEVDSGSKAEAPRKAQQPKAASMSELLAACKSPTELHLWCGIHGEAVEALAEPRRSAAIDAVKRRAAALGVTESSAMGWLLGEQPTADGETEEP